MIGPTCNTVDLFLKAVTVRAMAIDPSTYRSDDYPEITPLEALTPEQLEALKQEAEAIQAEVAASIEKLKKIQARNQPHEAIYHGIETKWFPLGNNHVYRYYGDYKMCHGEEKNAIYSRQRKFCESSSDISQILQTAGLELNHAKSILKTVAPATAFTFIGPQPASHELLHLFVACRSLNASHRHPRRRNVRC